MSKSSMKKYGILATALYFTALTTGVGAAWSLITIKANPASNKLLKDSYNDLKKEIDRSEEFIKTLDNTKWQYSDQHTKPSISMYEWNANVEKQFSLKRFFTEHIENTRSKIDNSKSKIKSKNFQEIDLKKLTLDLDNNKKQIKINLDLKIKILESIAKTYTEIAKKSVRFKNENNSDTQFKEKINEWFKKINKKLLVNGNTTEFESKTIAGLENIKQEVEYKHYTIDYEIYASKINSYIINDCKKTKDFLENKLKENDENWKKLRNQISSALNSLLDAENRANLDANTIHAATDNTKLSKINIDISSNQQSGSSSSFNNLRLIHSQVSEKITELEALYERLKTTTNNK